MKPTTHVTRPGDNHTGVALHPDMARDMIRGTVEFGPTSAGGAELLAQTRIRIARQSPPVATMPPTRVAANLLPFLDKLGGRLAFERAGVRIYDALLSKLEAYGTFDGGPSRADLERIRGEEHRHFALVEEMVLGLGGDPTVVTPFANLQMTASRGILDVLVDPRTSLVECLDVVLVAELTDHASWELLVAAAKLAGQQQLESRLREGERTEAEHLAKVRGWVAAAAKAIVD